MSYNMTDIVFDMPMPTNTKFVLLVLAHHCNDETGLCYPSRKTISDTTGMAQSTVGDHLKTLVEMGLVGYESTCGRTSNTYKLTLQPTGDRCINPPTAGRLEKSNPPVAESNPPVAEINPPVTGDKQVRTSKEQGFRYLIFLTGWI